MRIGGPQLNLYPGKSIAEVKPLPVVYDLVFRVEDDRPVFVFSAYDDMANEILPNAPIVTELILEHEGIGGFVSSPDSLGFDGIFTSCEPLYPLARFSSWRTEVPEKIIGIVGEHDWTPAVRLACSLSVLFAMAKNARVISNSLGLEQLAMFDTVCLEGTSGYSLTARLSSAASKWISENLQESIDVAQSAMVVAMGQMWSRFCTGDCRVFKNGNGMGIVLEAGSACGINVESSELDKSDEPGTTSGWNFESCNVDTSIQQITLLAGLCAILQLVRERLS